jgi:TolB-like protein/Flp pilus assembly protein TadD
MEKPAGMSGEGVTFSFDRFVLDPARFELRCEGKPVAMEPQVFSLLLLLVTNAERMVTRDEIVEQIWGGRIVSEAAISSRIKDARKAVGDDGKSQRLIRTIHGRGLRFVGEVTSNFPPTTMIAPLPAREAEHSFALHLPGDGRPAIAVLPLKVIGETDRFGFVAEALPDEIIMDLARLRWLRVIARGSTFRFRSHDDAVADVGKALGVGYCLTGSLEAQGAELVVRAELADVDHGTVIWNETYRGAANELSALRGEIVHHVVASLETQIASHEARKARQLPATALGAWSAYHLGLDLMYRFNRSDNERAAQLFARAVAADPEFSRAHAGLSFTHFQNAFLHKTGVREEQIALARQNADRALACDILDPFAHFNLGRTHWLDGDLSASVMALEKSVELSPNYSQGIYAKGLIHALSGEHDQAEQEVLQAMDLSPLDPLRYAMLSTQSLTQMGRGDYEAGARLSDRAAHTPGAHKHIALIAAIGANLAGDKAKANYWLDRVRQSDPDTSAEEFLRSFPFTEGQTRLVIERAMKDMGL